ncbi:cell cycle control protein [Piedraia hortae CBS 480.64]|uniref:Pre-mRNA-processing factor 19 n=1 Tax=Piedraia hortae CBS 480.64 TaxID=1314780 RepID=A0A6A7BYA0_9PEZI|nr:cell cycle control protein [Piedraia hortae CBS 480.64]
MLCAISGETPEHPVASRKSGNVFERRLIEAYIAENGTDPVNGEELSVNDLLDLKQSRLVHPRPPQLTSIPALLSTFQNEWDAATLEAFQLKQQLAQARQELSTALYYNDAAQRVIARLQKERDEARDALARVSLTPAAVGAEADGEPMQLDGQGLAPAVLSHIDEVQQKLSSTRRKRPVPNDWATGNKIQHYQVKSTADSQFTGAKFLAAHHTGDFFLCGDSDGTIGVYDLPAQTFTTRCSLGSGAVLDGTWAHNKAVVATESGAIVVTQDGAVQAKLHQHAGPAVAVATHPGGEIVASIGADQSYVLYNIHDSKTLTQTFCGEILTTVAFHPDGHLIAVGTASGSIKLYDVKTAQLAHTFPASTPAPIASLSFSENGTWLASAVSGQALITIWDLRKLSTLKSLDAGFEINTISWDYTGQFLLVSGPAGIVVIQYNKSLKKWSEPLRNDFLSVDAKWGSKAESLIALSTEGIVNVFG